MINKFAQETAGGGVKKLEKATITLADCLACSGCITSAETVLIEQQSADQVTVNSIVKNKTFGSFRCTKYSNKRET